MLTFFGSMQGVGAQKCHRLGMEGSAEGTRLRMQACNSHPHAPDSNSNPKTVALGLSCWRCTLKSLALAPLWDVCLDRKGSVSGQGYKRAPLRDM